MINMKAFLKKYLKYIMLGLAILFFGIAACVWFSIPSDSDGTADATDSLAAAASATPYVQPTAAPTAAPTPSVTEVPTADAEAPAVTVLPDGQVIVIATDLTPENTPAPSAEPVATPATPSREPAPDFTAKDGLGSSVTLSSHFGRPIIMYFWASWYDTCLSDLPGFNDAFHKYGDKVQILLVNLTDNLRDTEAGVKKFCIDKGYDAPVLFDVDGSAMSAYGVYVLPMTVMIDENGNIKSSRLGSMDARALEGYIREMMIEAGIE